ncbi:hook3 protein [Beauveria bassiana ARSEF 2860]|uniref:Hook3 protein n=1 Tax=Beauveria bassiana (strain ARSEF 2860) TaxID=655819 RepID=J5JXR1_BEAB2|nr:hook3 protein [Beauveria bassiana ARSEF 2860]EJP69273.1 hook3 protein [Beauveria bassiana ARSEF 2860]
MPVYSNRAQVALLKAVNHVFSLDRKADSLEDLTNGIILANILHELDAEFDPSHLESNPATSRYLTNKRNIQAVYKGLFRFIRRQIPELGCQAQRFDYHAVAENPEPQGLSQLLAVMVSAAAMGPDNKKYVPLIQTSLDKVNQAEIMNIIRAMQVDAANAGDEDKLHEDMEAVMEARDMDLVVEEQNAALRQQLDINKKALSDYITRLEHLQQSHEELKYEKERNDRELEVLRKATKDGANNAEAIRLLEDQVHEQMEIIAKNEESIRNHERARAQFETEVQKLTQRSQHADELRDQATEWRHKAEELEKKANAAERYKQKLESQQHLVKEVQNLQYERAELQEQLRSLMDEREKGDRTRKAEDELTRMLTQSEQHLWDERSQKTQLLKDMQTLEDELLRLKAQRSHDEHFIQELQDQVQHGGGASQAETLALPASSSLQDELNSASSDDGQKNIPLELSRFKAENDLLRRTIGSAGDAATLRKEADDEKKQRERLQQSLNELFEKHTIVQHQIEALMQSSTGESSKAFIELRSEHTRTQNELQQLKKRTADLQVKLADKDRDLMGAKTELSAVQKDGISALDQLKSTDKLISESLKAELDRLREELAFVSNERESQKTQLIDALLAKDKFRKDAEEAKELQETAALSTANQDSSGAAKKAAEKIEKLRNRLIERKQQLEQAEQDKIDLQRELKVLQGGELATAQKAATEKMIKNLQRENVLIATAWYDLTSRLQSNHVVLQRRHDAPKSWLNKQRQMVHGQLRQRDMLYLY